MERGSLVTLVAGLAFAAGLFGTAPAVAAGAATTNQAEPPTSQRASLGERDLHPSIDADLQLVDPARLAADPATVGRLRYDYLAWLPTPVTKTQELDPMLVIRQVVGRRLVSSDDFCLVFIRGRHLLSADVGSTHIGIAPTSFSLTQGTMFTVAGVF